MYDFLFGDRDPVAEPGTATGTPGDWWTTFALAPDILKHCVDGFSGLSQPGALHRSGAARARPDPRRLGQGFSQFVFSQHCKSLRGLKVSNDKIAAIPSLARFPTCFTDQERAVLAYADCLCQAGGRTPLAVFDMLRTFWDDVQILEFTYITCLYDMHAVMTKALRLEFDNRDDPIVEIAAPESFSAADFLSAGRPGGATRPG